MTERLRIAGLAIATMALAAAFTPAGIAQTAPAPTAAPADITFTRVAAPPKDYQTSFQLYDKVDKVDRKIVRFLYINKDALAKVKPGQPFPDGTVLIMEDHEVAVDTAGLPMKSADGRLQPTARVRALSLMEKRAGWGETNLLPADKDNGDWEYAAFRPDGTPNPVKLDNCYACHLPHKALDFTFSGAAIYAAAPK